MEQLSRIQKLMDVYESFDELDVNEGEIPAGVLCYQQIAFKYFSRLDSMFDSEELLYSERLFDIEDAISRFFCRIDMNSCAERWLQCHSDYFVQDSSFILDGRDIIDKDEIQSVFGRDLGRKLLFYAREWMYSPQYYGASNALYFMKVDPLIMWYMEQPMLFHLTDEERLTADMVVKRLKNGGFLTSKFSDWVNCFFLSVRKEAAIFIFATRSYLSEEFEYGWLNLIMLDIGFILGYQWLCERLEKEVMKGENERRIKRKSSMATCRENA